MITFASRLLLVASDAVALVWALALAATAAAQSSNVPNFQSGPSGWQHPFAGEFLPVQGPLLLAREPYQPVEVAGPQEILQRTDRREARGAPRLQA
jgi:hypothetical protein